MKTKSTLSYSLRCEYIRKNWKKMLDKEMAKNLGLHETTIARIRKSLGLEKKERSLLKIKRKGDAPDYPEEERYYSQGMAYCEKMQALLRYCNGDRDLVQALLRECERDKGLLQKILEEDRKGMKAHG